MNFQELYNRIRELDQPVIEEPNEGNAYGQAVQNTPPGEEIKINGKGTGDIKREDSLSNECGMDMGPSSSPMKQQDNVSMNVNMSGSGAGGIRDLIDILRNIDGGDTSSGDDLGAMISKMDHPDDSQGKAVVIGDDQPVDEFANEPNEITAPVDAVINTGTMDLHSPHKSYSDKPYRGDNPMALENIRARLDAIYRDMTK